ncbi:HNH endonuclease signature motif containing protein [Gordonia phthalatica]|uniref:HNH endonuclease n=1 Tax=Gordonia phthalatica TaxID=1136941 RepID=A0A0N9N0W5_9ACTN|nr:HNH endonuclease signature motif containing protein [Gordonia phthalatica]ALG84241.1 HNH endonuclease [Gordonia phthalatica]
MAGIDAAFADVVDQFADVLTEALCPPGESTSGGELARLCAAPSTVGSDDDRILAMMVGLARVLNLSTTALSQVAEVAERAGTRRRKRLKSPVELLKQLGVVPALAQRLVRVGQAARQMPGLMSRARVGGVPIEQADAVARGISFVQKRVPLDDESLADLVRRLSSQATPKDVDNRARELAIEWAPEIDETDPDAVPVAENPDLNEMTLVTGQDGRTIVSLDTDALSGEELSQALDPLCKPIPQPDGTPDPRSASQRRADAHAQIIRDYLAGRDRPTVSGGVLPHVTLIVPIAQASAETGAAQESSRVASLGFTGPVSASTVGLVVCEAAMRRVVMDADSAPMDVGREHRLVTAGLRKALEARDRGCAFPGCGRPVSWTDAHHCTPWSEGGDTAIDNCVLLCRMHHTVIHQTGWEVFIGHDRHPWFRPPLDPDHPKRFREPIRSNARRTMTLEPTAAA